MNSKTTSGRGALPTGLLGAVLGLAAAAAAAQDTTPVATSAASIARDPNPYYIGASEALTHDSNVYRTTSAKSDTYSTTSLLGGFDQPIGRQRIFGNASVGLNRYADQTQLNNTSYNLAGGLAWQTINSLSGNLNVSASQGLSSPAASGVAPPSTRNLAQTESIDARARWGGPSLLTLEGGLGYSRVDYDDPAFASSESRRTTGSLGLYYHRSTLLSIGVAGRVTRTETPEAFRNTTTNAIESNTVRSDNLDFLVDYELTGLLTSHTRISYTRQTNSGLSTADFSGLTGSLSLAYQPTGKTSINFDVSRDAGLNSSLFNGAVVDFSNGAPVLSPIQGQYQNNQITNSVGVKVGYAATGKILANAGYRYSRARLLTTVVTPLSTQPGVDTTDVSQVAYIGANWAVARNWALACNLGHENRKVSGGSNYSYNADTVSCSAQFTWR